MVKLVVADDEERVCRLIVALGNWEELGIKVVGTAANGIQALELIRRYQNAGPKRTGTDRESSGNITGYKNYDHQWLCEF